MDHAMCKGEGLATPQYVPVADVQKASPSLAKCKKAAEIMHLKPDIGALTVGGNKVGLEHNIDGNTHALVKASYVANVCFVCSINGTKRQDTVLLQHGSTTKDLKRRWYEKFKTGFVQEAIKKSGLQGFSEKDVIASIICRGENLGILEDDHELPTASLNACSDVGYHAQFLLGITPPSMRQDHIGSKINASKPAIRDFANTTRVLGAESQPNEYPHSYAEIQQELDDRLKTVTREVPAPLRAQPLEDTSAQFQAIIDGEEEEEDGECGSNLALTYKRYADELAEQVQSGAMDSLSAAFPEDAKSHLMAMKPYVGELARVQRSSEWTNYKTETDHEDGLAVCDIVSELKEREKSLKDYEDIALAKPNVADLAPESRRETRRACEQLEDLFKPLHKTFEGAKHKQVNLAEKLQECEKVCDQHLKTAKMADSGFKATLAEERRNLEALEQLDKESKLLHGMACEQIKWCSDQVDYSRAQTSNRIECINKEIARLQDLKQKEEHRLENLAKRKVQIEKVKAEEDRRAEESSRKRASAKRNASTRVERAEKAVRSSEDMLQRLKELYDDVKLEFADAMEYGTELLKAVGVDCHTAFLGHGKFLAIELEKANKNLGDFEKTREEKLRRKIELESQEDEDCQATIDRAEEARRELDKAERNVTEINDKIKANKDSRGDLVRDYSVVDTFLRRHASSSNPNQVMAMPMAKAHTAVDEARIDCCNVAEYRDQRGDAPAIPHTLGSLESFEDDFGKRYRGETASNLKTMFTNMNKTWGLGRLLGQ